MDKTVEILGFEPLPKVVTPCALYCLILAGKVVYVGKSTNVYARVARHWQNMTRVKAGKAPYDKNTIALIDFDSVVVRFCEKDRLAVEEMALIQRLRPLHNKQLNRPVSTVDVMKIPAIVEIMSRNERARPVEFKKRRWSVAA